MMPKGSCGYGETKNVIAFSVQKNVVAVAGFQIISIDAKPNSADNGNLGKLGFTSLHGTVFACTKAMIISKGSYGYGDPKI